KSFELMPRPSRTCEARRSSSTTVNARHSTTGSLRTSRGCRRRFGSRGPITPQSIKRPPLRDSAKTGSPSGSETANPAIAGRRAEGVGEPWAELVKRDDPVAGDRGMAAAIAERDAGEADATGPDRPEDLQQGVQDLRRRKGVVARGPDVVEVAETRRRAEEE